MRIKQIIFCISFLCLNLIGNAQNKFETSLSYFGETGLHPGVKFGFNYAYKQKEKTKYKTKRNGTKLQKGLQHQFLLMGNAGGYHHAKYLTNLFVSVESGYRLNIIRKKENKKRKVYFFESTIGIGYLRYFHYGTTFETTADGFTKKELGGGNSFMPTSSIGFGTNIPNQKELPIYWFIKPTFFMELPQTSFPVMHLALDVGVRMELNFNKNSKNNN